MKDTRLIVVVISLAFCESVWGVALPDLVGWQETGQDAYFFKAYDANTQALLTQVKWGQQIQIKYMIKNTGLANAGAFHVNFYLSKDSTIGNSDDIKLGYAYWSTGLAAGTYSKKTSPTLKIPSTMSGAFSETSTLYLGMKIDPNSKITEANETNNYNRAIGKDKRNITQAARTITDNFNDNTRNVMWAIFGECRKCWLTETNSRLEVRGVSGGNFTSASYVCEGFRIIPSRDFSLSINYFNNVASTNETCVYFDISPYLVTKNIASIGVSRDPNSWLWCDVEKGDGSTVEDEKPCAASGKLYISYSASKDELYLSNTGTGSANAWKTIPGMVKGIWKSGPIYINLGGEIENLTINSGQIYMDNFSCTGLLGVCKPYSYTDDFADSNVASFWQKTEESPSKIYETSGRLEFRTASAPSDYVDSYYTTKYKLDPTRDFVCSVNFAQLMTNTTGDTAVWIGIATDTLENKLSFCVGRDDSGRYFEYELEVGYDVTTGNDTVRSINSGKLYISYSAALDEIYLSWTDFGKADAKWTVKGAIKGKWGSKPLVIAIGAWSDGVIVPAGKLYLDNFVAIGEKK